MQSIINRFPVVKSPYRQALLAMGCMGLFVVPALFVRVTSHSRKGSEQVWMPASAIAKRCCVRPWRLPLGEAQIAPASLIQTAITQNSTGGVDADKVKVLQVPNQGKGRLFIFDFQSVQLCGAGGCLYAIYQESGNLLLTVLADPKLPKGEALFKVDDVVRNGFSCLVITQTTTSVQTVLRTQYCYQGTGFVRVNEVLTQVGQGLN
jgi:hypothetical protein